MFSLPVPYFISVLYVYCIGTGSFADPGCFIPDPDPYIFHPGSGSWNRGVKTHRIPDPTVLKKKFGKIISTFFLLLMVSGTNFISKKIKEQEFLRKS
jgi:hypothetical protein